MSFLISGEGGISSNNRVCCRLQARISTTGEAACDIALAQWGQLKGSRYRDRAGHESLDIVVHPATSYAPRDLVIFMHQIRIEADDDLAGAIMIEICGDWEVREVPELSVLEQAYLKT